MSNKHQVNKPSENGGILSILDQIDKKLTSYISNLEFPTPVQYYIFFWGWVFNKEGPLFVLMTLIYILYSYDSG